MNVYHSHNKKVFKIGIENYANKVIKAKILEVCKSVAKTIVDEIDYGFSIPDGTDLFPVYTANLRDATGVGVYADGVIQYFMPTAKATTTQEYGFQEGISGSSLLKQAITNGASRFSRGIWIVLFSTVPYAYGVNVAGSPLMRGIGFFDALKQDLLSEVIVNLMPIDQ